MRKTPKKTVWIDSHHGVYSWQFFAQSFKDRAATVSNIDDETWAELEAGPDHEHYWDAASAVESDAIVTIDGRQYFVFQDEDIWLIPVGMEYDDDSATYEWPKWGEGKLEDDL